MKWFIVGYSWCPHFQHAKQTLLEIVDVREYCIASEEPDREQLQQKLYEIIGDRKVIGSPGVTSPQIIGRSKKYAVCIAGDDELTAIPQLKTFAKDQIASYRIFVKQESKHD